MYLHEFQAKQLLLEHGIRVAPFHVVESMDDVEKAIAHGFEEAVVKIQVHAGGRGKAGGIKRAKNAQEIREHVQNLLGMRLVNNQTGPEGVVAEKILLDTPIQFSHEYYLGVVIDRKTASISVIASREGGMEIEEIAKKNPEKIVREEVPSSGRLHHFQLMRLAKKLGWNEDDAEIIQKLLAAFQSLDATLIEINPLVQTKDGLIALDAKIQIDDNALFRQPRLEAMWDPLQQTKAEALAHEFELSYVGLDGTIGCMVNGAGLAMATMDLIRFWGGSPANFLDVGGGASVQKVIEGFKILFSDSTVKAVFVNIFGGIMNCEVIAKALIEVGCSSKVVMRMEGTNVESAKKMLASSGIEVIFKDDLDEAAKTVCELVK